MSCNNGKMERPAGLAPAFPGWKPGVLLLDDGRFGKMKTNTAASPVKDSHPQENFSADLSVFQAHLPWRELYLWRYIFCRSLWFDISSRAWIRDNAGPSASHRLMTRLTVESRGVTVIAVEHSQSFSLDLLDCRPISPRRQLPLAAGFSRPDGGYWKIMGMVGVVGWYVENARARCCSPWNRLNRWIYRGKRGKQKPRRLQERAGFSMKIDDRFRS